MRPTYSQKNISVTVDGTLIQGLHEGASYTFKHDGGEVQKTEGTDGPGINIATDQGATLTITLRETSTSHGFLQALKKAQDFSGVGAMVTVRTGADVLYAMPDSIIGAPGENASGDKKQAGVQYTFMSTSYTSSNM